MTTREKIDNLLNNSSEMFLESIWDNLLNYHNLSQLNDYGYTLGETRYTLYSGGTKLVPITEILHEGNQIMFFNEYDKSFEKNVRWDNIFLTKEDAKNHAMKTISNLLSNLEQTFEENL